MIHPLLFRRCRWWLLFVIAWPVFSFAQGSNNTIEINLLEESYDCSTGQVTVKFHVTNYDENGNYGMYHTAVTINAGASGRSLNFPQGNNDFTFTGAYNPGDLITITAYGLSNNAAPSTSFPFVASAAPAPDPPSISSSASMPLCNGSSTILTASGSTGSYVWSNGQTGTSISVSAPGDYTARAVSGCGTSSESNVITVTVGSIPSAPVIGSSAGTLLCNGQSTNFSATSSGGTINWSNSATGTSMTTSAPGTYYASETNGCGTSGNSNVITITSGNTPGAPTVTSSNGTSLCNGQSTVLTAAQTAGGAISWNTGQTGNSITISSPGTYYAVESNGCGTGGNSNLVTITTGTAPSAPTISSSNGTLLCNGASTILTASGGGIISWNTGANGSSISVTAPGNYYAVATNSCGVSGASNTITISTNQTPAAPFVLNNGGTLLCNGASVTLSTSPSFGGTIRWNTGASGNSLSVSTAGDYYAYEANGCGNGSNSNVVAITTTSTPAAPTVTPAGDQLLCNGASVTLTSSGSNVLWSNAATGNTITTFVAGAYYAIDRNACGNSAQSNIVNVTTVVCPTPAPGSSYFVCPGALKTLDAGAGYDTYEWSNGATTRTIAVGPGTYTVTVSKQGCFATSAAVTVGYYTVTTPTISASGATIFCAGGTVTLLSSPGSAYSWNTGATSSSINVNTPGAYFVTVTDANGCQATSAAVNVTVNPLPIATISGNASVCQNGTAPVVVFTGSGGAPPYTFSYRVNSGSVQTVTTTSGNSVSVSVPTGNAGNFVYELVSVQESSSTACSNSASGSVTVSVNALPSASISGNANVCKNSASPAILFSATGGSGPYTFTYRINGGANQIVTTTSGNSASVSVPTIATGTLVYSLVSVQEPSGCANNASGIATVTINPLPDASITGSATVCQGNGSPVISFSGSGGVAPYKFTYTINGGAQQTITTSTGNSVSLSVPTSTAGDFVYTLVSVQESSGTACVNTANGSVTVTVRALPTSSISGTTTLCKNATAPSIVFTGNGGTAPYTFGYRINGGALQTVTTSSGNTVSVQVPTGTEGTFTYTLVSVQEAGSTACSNTASGSATITVNPLPTATITGNTSVCQNGTAPLVTFTGAGGVAPYTFVYRVGSGSNQTVISTGNTATVTVPVSTAGSFTYTLVGVQDASSTACSNSASGSVTIVVNPQPVKAIITANNMHLCNGETGTLKVTNYVSGSTYYWYKDGALINTTTTDAIQVTTSGSYTVLVVNASGCAAATYSDAIVITTGSVTTPVITGSLKVCEGGRTMLTARSNDEKAYDGWRWTGPPGGRLLSEDSSFFVGAGQYRVRVSTQGCADSVNVAVTADDTEFPAGKLTPNQTTIAYGDAVTLHADVQGAVSYKWDLGNGRQFSSTATEVTEHYYMNSDSVPVKLWATSARNCTTIFTTTVKVGAMPTRKLPDNSFAGTVKDWNVFPIPFTNKLTITAILQARENVRIDLFAPDGRWVRSWTKSGKKGENIFTLDDMGDLAVNVLYFITAVYNGEKHFDKIYKY